MKKELFILRITAFLFIICEAVSAQQSNIDSLVRAIKATTNDTDKVDLINSLSQKLRNRNPDTAIILGNEALGIINKSTEFKGARKDFSLMQTWNTLGLAYYAKEDFSNSLGYQFKVHEQCEKMEETASAEKRLELLRYKCGSLGNIGTAYSQQGNFSKSLDFFFRGLKITEELGDSMTIEMTLANIGSIYNCQKEYSKALDYYFRSMEMAEAINDRIGVVLAIGNIGVVYTTKGDHLQALEYYAKSLKISEKLDYPEMVAAVTGNIGAAYYNLGNYDSALVYFNKAIELKKQINDNSGVALVLGNMSSMYVKQKKYALAIASVKSALTMVKESMGYTVLRDIYQIAAQVDSATGNYESAYEKYKLFIAYRDSVSNEENTKNQTRLEMQYEFDKKESVAKAEQQKKDAINAEEKRKQEIILWAVGGGLILVMAFAGFIFKAYRQKKIANFRILKQKDIIEEKQKEILDSIYYARRIQRSLLPTERYIEKNLNKIRK